MGRFNQCCLNDDDNDNWTIETPEHSYGFTYWQRELLQAVHPALKVIAKVEDETGGIPPSSVLFGMIANNTENICEGFKDDREVQMFLTLYFWKYLCHFANIDFYTGMDKTKLYLDMRR